MALIDMFGSSFAGLARGQRLLEAAARTIADPGSYGLRPAASDAAFHEILHAQLTAFVNAGSQGRDGDPGTARFVSTPVAPPAAALMAESGQDFLGAILDMLIARRMIEANARMIAIQNSVVGTIIDLGK